MADYDLVLIEQVLWVISQKTNQPQYDFPVSEFFPSKRPYERPSVVTTVARLGAIDDYELLYSQLFSDGIQLINNPFEHKTCSELSGWYSQLEDLTPRSIVYDISPSAKIIGDEFGWPIFMKGMRQTSRHQRKLAIIENADHYANAIEAFENDPILHWQSLVVREFIPLRPVGSSTDQESIAASFEFRCFFWKNHLVGFGNYWNDEKYKATSSEMHSAIELATKAAERIKVPFLVIDVALTVEGKWIVIECNDAQESGYAGVSRIALWQNIIAIELDYRGTKHG